MKIWLKKIVLCIFLITVGSMAISEKSYAKNQGYIYIESNKNAQNYGTGLNWSQCMKSFLAEEENGYYRIDANMEGDILVERYTQEFHCESYRWITKELPLFGGFYAGKDSYFFVFGQVNTEESDKKEVVRIVKYDKTWNRVGAASLYGANTVAPFAYGNLRMAESDGILYVHTCHQMYKSKKDGRNHQANLFFAVNTVNMTIEEEVSGIVWGRGYVSHSFNQFVQTDDRYVYRLDHGDAYPRSITISKWEKDKIKQPEAKESDILKIAGETGNNYTGASIGGLECSTDTCITVGNSIIQDGKHDSDSGRNIYVTSTKKDSIGKSSENGTTFRWLTNYTAPAQVSTPQLAKVNDDSFLVLWNILSEGEAEKFCYAFLDGDGNLVGSIHTESGVLSDCQPILSNGRVIWYTVDDQLSFCTKADGSRQLHYVADKSLLFYAIGTDGILKKTKAVFPEKMTITPKSVENCRMILTKIGELDEADFYENHCLMIGDTVLCRGTDYNIDANIFWEEIEADIEGIEPYWNGETNVKINSISKYPILRFVKQKQNGINISWQKETGALGYYLYRKIGNGKMQCIKKIEDSSKTSWTDSYKPNKKTNVIYGIKAYTWNGSGKEILTEMSECEGIIPAVSSIKVKQSGKQGIKVSWKKSANVGGYEVWCSDTRSFYFGVSKHVNKTSSTIAKLYRKLTYYVKVRAYVKYNGQKIYGKWSKVKSVKIK